jgi:hypothetical protein
VIQHIADNLNVQNTTSNSGMKFQNGVKYRTLCSTCNNSILGAKHDPEFSRFTNEISRHLLSYRQLPQSIVIEAKPQRIMRSLLGHICAQGVDRYRKGEHTEEFRDYLLNDDLPLPDFLNIYYWIFPHQRQVLVRDSVLTDLNVNEPVFMWLMKFFPIAFFVAWDKPSAMRFNLNELSAWREAGINDQIDIPVDFTVIPPKYWPEFPTETSFVVYGREAIASAHKK